MNIYLGVLFGLLYAVIVALGKVALKKSLKDFPSSISFFIETLFGLLLWISYSMILGINMQSVAHIFHYVLISAVLSEAYVFYIYTKGELNLIGSVFSTYSIFTVLFSQVFNHEPIGSKTVLFILITIIGTLIIAFNPGKSIINKSGLLPVLWALSGAIAVGFSDTISKRVIDNSNSADFLFALALAQIPVSLVYIKLERQSLSQIFWGYKDFNKYKFSVISALLLSLSMIFFWLSFEFTYASIALTNYCYKCHVYCSF